MVANATLKLASFSGNTRVLHLTWLAFFVSFMVWFAHAPLMAIIRDQFGLSEQQVTALLILNVALTIPARIVVGMLVDRLGPKIMFAAILVLSGSLSIAFALADNFQQLALVRFLLGFAGAGFVVGIRMIAEWFPARQTGLAQGIYGGWGNMGSGAAALLLPALALTLGGDNGWRYAVGGTGLVAIAYGMLYYFSVSNTPKGSTYFKAKKMGAMEVTSSADFFLYLLMSIPMVAALGLLVWKLSPAGLGWFGADTSNILYLLLVLIFLYQALRIFQINRGVFRSKTPDIFRYRFSQVAVLDLAYMVSFGSELAMVSMLSLFYKDTFGLPTVSAGLLAAVYPLMNLVARPAGGLISDRLGRKRSLLIFFAGIVVAFSILAQVDTDWPLAAVVFVSILCAAFAQAASGAVFAMVPLVQRRMTGQIAGMAGAYGNVGAVLFLTTLSLVSIQHFFLAIAAAGLGSLIAIMLLMREPAGQMAEIMPDGQVQMIDVR